MQQHRKELELAEKTRYEQQREAKVCGLFCFVVFSVVSFFFLAVATYASTTVVCGVCCLPFFCVHFPACSIALPLGRCTGAVHFSHVISSFFFLGERREVV